MATSVPNAPVRRLDKNDKAILNASAWHETNTSNLKLEDKVSLADSKAVFLQGLVVYVGKVHFEEGIWVGVQLTGPSIGRGFCDGTYKGQKYFASVGKNNGVLAPLSKVSKRLGTKTGDEEADALQQQRQSDEARMADLEFIDCLTESRALAILKLDEEKRARGLNRLRKEETHVTRLKELRFEELMRARGMAVPEKKSEDLESLSSNNKYAGPNATLSTHDLELAEGLEQTQQNYCLSDPSLPDNPITYVSQPFLNMTGYNLNEILGKNCRFLQGPDTDKYHVYRVRKSIVEGADCHVCLLNYRKDGTPFYNRLFMTALRDTKGRIKNYLGVQCEVPEHVAMRINATEKAKFEARSKNARLSSTFEEASENGSIAPSMRDAKEYKDWENLSVSHVSLSDKPRQRRRSSARSLGPPKVVEEPVDAKSLDGEVTDDAMTQSTAGGSNEDPASPEPHRDFFSKMEEEYYKATGDEQYRFL